MERKQTKSIAELIREFLKESKLDKKLKERELLESWEKLLGTTVNRATQRIYIRDRILYVHLSSSVIRHEIHMLKDEIIRRLNESAGENLVSDIRLK